MPNYRPILAARFVIRSGHGDGPLKRLFAAILCRAALRRCTAALCAVAFLVVGFAHALQHIDTVAPTLAWQSESGEPDASADHADKAKISVEHCHACTMVSEAATTEALPFTDRVTAPPVVRVSDAHPAPPVAEAPPPKSSI